MGPQRKAGQGSVAHPHLPMLCPQAQYVFLYQCILRFLQQSSPVPAEKGPTYENLLFENVAPTEA